MPGTSQVWDRPGLVPCLQSKGYFLHLPAWTQQRGEQGRASASRGSLQEGRAPGPTPDLQRWAQILTGSGDPGAQGSFRSRELGATWIMSRGVVPIFPIWRSTACPSLCVLVCTCGPSCCMDSHEKLKPGSAWRRGPVPRKHPHSSAALEGEGASHASATEELQVQRVSGQPGTAGGQQVLRVALATLCPGGQGGLPGRGASLVRRSSW